MLPSEKVTMYKMHSETHTKISQIQSDHLIDRHDIANKALQLK